MSRARLVTTVALGGAAWLALTATVLPRGPDIPSPAALAPGPVPLAAKAPLRAAPPPARTYELRPGHVPPGTTAAGDITLTDSGFVLGARGAGRLRVPLRLEAPRGRRVFAYVSTAGHGPIRSSMAVVDSRGRRPFGDAPWTGLAQRLDVTEAARRGPLFLELDGANGTAEPVALLPRIVLLSAARGPEWPPWWRVGPWALATATLLFLLLRLGGLGKLSAAGLTAVVAVGAAVRIDALVEIADRPLLPDAATYRYLADELQHPYDTGAREPLFPALLRAWFEAVGSTDVTQRLLTVAIWVAVVLATYRLIAGYTRRAALGVLGAAIVAAHPLLGANSIEGLREPLYLLLLVLLAHELLIPDTRGRAGARLIALAAALAVLRVTTLPVVAVLLVLAVLVRTVRPRVAAGALAAAVVALAPHLAYEQRHFGDAFWPTDTHGTFFRNVEFVLERGTGCDTCPSLAQLLSTGSAAGTKISALEYIFGFHSAQTVIRDTGEGFVSLLLSPWGLLPELLGFGLLVPLYLIGLACAVATRRWMLPALPLATLNLLPFVVERVGFDIRIALHVAPFLTLIALLPLQLLLERARGLPHAGDATARRARAVRTD